MSEEEARALIKAESCATHIKAQMFSTWQSARAEYEKQSVSAYDYYQMSCLREVEACVNQDWDEADRIGDQATSFRNQNFTKQDWERLIEETNNIQAKIGLTKAMNKLFPE